MTIEDILTWLTELIKGYKFFEEQHKITCDIDKELTRIWFRSEGFTVKPNDGIIWTDIIQW